MIPDIAQSRTAGSMPVAVKRACREHTSEQAARSHHLASGEACCLRQLCQHEYVVVNLAEMRVGPRARQPL